MNKTIGYLAAFAAGAAAGFLTARQLLKMKYRKQADEEVASVKEAYERREKEKAAAVEKQEQEVLKMASSYDDLKDEADEAATVITSYKDILERSNYVPQQWETPPDKPYVISEDELGSMEDYDIIYRLYFADGVLTDDQFEPIDEPAFMRALKDWVHKDEDEIWLRNDARKCDYDVTKDLRKYTDVAYIPGYHE